jgi:hypothetical protein
VRHRVHQPIEIFQKLHGQRIDDALKEAGFFSMNEAHYAAEGAALVDESEVARKARVKSTQSLRMQLRTRVVNAVFAEISVEERAIIDGRIEEEKAEAAREMGKGKGKGKRSTVQDDEGERTPEEYQA